MNNPLNSTDPTGYSCVSGPDSKHCVPEPVRLPKLYMNENAEEKQPYNWRDGSSGSSFANVGSQSFDRPVGIPSPSDSLRYGDIRISYSPGNGININNLTPDEQQMMAVAGLVSAGAAGGLYGLAAKPAEMQLILGLATGVKTGRDCGSESCGNSFPFGSSCTTCPHNSSHRNSRRGAGN